MWCASTAQTMSLRSSPSEPWRPGLRSGMWAGVLGMPYQAVDQVAKQVPSELKMTLSKALKVSHGPQADV